jgi:ABC-type hemin transport system ATPase subunit
LTETDGVAVVATTVSVVQVLEPTGIARIVAVAGPESGKVTVRRVLCGYVTAVGDALSVSTPWAEATEATTNAETIATPIQSKILFRI